MRMFTRAGTLAMAIAAVSVWAVAEGPATNGLSVPLKGVSKDNAGKIETALAKLDRNGFRCKTCDYFSTEEGDCPECETKLVADKAGILLKDVKVDVATGNVTFGVAGASGVRLSEIEAVLPAGVTIDKATFPIVPFTRLTVTGVSSEEAGEELQAAFKEAKLFDSVKATIDADHGVAILIVGGAKTIPTHEAVAKTIEKAGPLTLSEVTWTAACAACAGKGMTRAGCPSCWEKRP